MRRGSITLYLCLVLSILLSLIFAGLMSARLAAGRVVLASGLEQGLYSLFAGYDRELFDSYGLLFLDGGFGNEDLQLGQLLQEVEEAAEYVICPGEGPFRQPDLLGMALENGELTGYTLATDNGGAAFRRQVCEVIRAELGAAGVEALAEMLKERLGIVQEQEKQTAEIDEEGVQREYEALLQEANGQRAEQKTEEQAKAERMTEPSGGRDMPEKTVRLLQYRIKERAHPSEEKVLPDTEQSTEGGQPAEAPENFENPIEVISNIRKMGILSLALPNAAQLSGFSADKQEMPSGRELQQGMGVLAAEEPGTIDKILLQEYLIKFFPCYTSESQGEGLRYQVEYAIGKKQDDIENLKSVLNRLLAVREASNMIYLMTSPARSAEADEMALLISSVLLMPQAAPLVSLLLKLCWSFGESILDLRELLKGGKVPLLKDDSSWKLSLNALSGLMEAESAGDESSGGLDYQWYLRILLLMESQESVTSALMDLTEYNMRIQNGRKTFRLDSCVETAEVSLTAGIQNHSFSIVRSYGYDME